MPKLLSSKQVVRVLEKNNFIFISQKGSHMKFRKYGRTTFTVIIPANKREIPVGTLRSIIRQSGLKDQDFGI